MTKSGYLIGALAVVALIVSVLCFTSVSGLRSEIGDKVSSALGAAGIGPTHYQTENFLQGAYFGTAGQTFVGSTGTVAFGSSGTPITGVTCNASSSFNPPSLVNNATTTFDIALTGATTSLKQTYSWGLSSLATTTVLNLIAGVSPSSTSGFVHVTLQNHGGTLDIPTSTFSICYTQF